MTNSVHIHVHIDPQPLKFLEIPEIVTGGCVDLRQPPWWPPPRRWQNREMCTTKPKGQPQFFETSRLESARSLHTERTHPRAKETAETA